MPNIETLKDTVQQNLNLQATDQTACFATLDLKCAYSQLYLNPEILRHCNFNIVSGKYTGTYCVIASFYGLTDIPAAFRKFMHYKLIGLKNTHCFLVDIIIFSRGSPEQHFNLVYKCLKTLD